MGFCSRLKVLVSAALLASPPGESQHGAPESIYSPWFSEMLAGFCPALDALGSLESWAIPRARVRCWGLPKSEGIGLICIGTGRFYINVFIRAINRSALELEPTAAC